MYPAVPAVSGQEGSTSCSIIGKNVDGIQSPADQINFLVRHGEQKQENSETNFRVEDETRETFGETHEEQKGHLIRR